MKVWVLTVWTRDDDCGYDIIRGVVSSEAAVKAWQAKDSGIDADEFELDAEPKEIWE